jgi:hypothetical protein
MDKWLLLWWDNKEPRSAVMDDEIQAEMTARPRNAILMHLRGEVEVESIVDFWRRDKDGNPMPALERNLSGVRPRTGRGFASMR